MLIQRFYGTNISKSTLSHNISTLNQIQHQPATKFGSIPLQNIQRYIFFGSGKSSHSPQITIFFSPNQQITKTPTNTYDPIDFKSHHDPLKKNCNKDEERMSCHMIVNVCVPHGSISSIVHNMTIDIINLPPYPPFQTSLLRNREKQRNQVSGSSSSTHHRLHLPRVRKPHVVAGKGVSIYPVWTTTISPSLPTFFSCG